MLQLKAGVRQEALKEEARIRGCSTFIPSGRFFSLFFLGGGRFCILFKPMVTLLKEARKALVSQDLSQLHIHFVIFLITNEVGPRNNYTEHKRWQLLEFSVGCFTSLPHFQGTTSVSWELRSNPPPLTSHTDPPHLRESRQSIQPGRPLIVFSLLKICSFWDWESLTGVILEWFLLQSSEFSWVGLREAELITFRVFADHLAVSSGQLNILTHRPQQKCRHSLGVNMERPLL